MSADILLHMAGVEGSQLSAAKPLTPWNKWVLISAASEIEMLREQVKALKDMTLSVTELEHEHRLLRARNVRLENGLEA